MGLLEKSNTGVSTSDSKIDTFLDHCKNPVVAVVVIAVAAIKVIGNIAGKN